jgi:hypothetical protein
MTTLSSFEVLSQSLIPNSGPGIPYAVQAYFVQVSFPSGESAGPVSFDLTFEETTNFTQGVGHAGVMAQYIDENGAVNEYPTFFTVDSLPGFLGQEIYPGQTKIYSVTVAPPTAPTANASEAAVPQTGTGWRGVANLNPSTSGLLVATPTERQLYFTGDLQTITDSVVAFVPTASGGTRI